METLITTTRSRSVLIDAPVEKVFAFVTTVGNWTRCHPGNTGITGVSDRPLKLGEPFVEHAQLAEDLPKLDLEWIVSEVDEPLRWVVALGESPWGMESIEIAYECEPHGDGTRFRRTTRFVGTAEARSGTTSDLTERVDEADDQYLDNLRDAIEAGG